MNYIFIIDISEKFSLKEKKEYKYVYINDQSSLEHTIRYYKEIFLTRPYVFIICQQDYQNWMSKTNLFNQFVNSSIYLYKDNSESSLELIQRLYQNRTPMMFPFVDNINFDNEVIKIINCYFSLQKKEKNDIYYNINQFSSLFFNQDILDESKIDRQIDIALSLLNLNKHLSYNKIKISLYEALINAVEHGNLGITESEKELFLNINVYEKKIQNFINEKPFSTVMIYFSRKKQIINIAIEDNNNNSLRKKQIGDKIFFKEPIKLAGRGMKIIKATFDHCEFVKIKNGRKKQLKLSKTIE